MKTALETHCLVKRFNGNDIAHTHTHGLLSHKHLQAWLRNVVQAICAMCIQFIAYCIVFSTTFCFVSRMQYHTHSFLSLSLSLDALQWNSPPAEQQKKDMKFRCIFFSSKRRMQRLLQKISIVRMQ